MRGRHSGYHRGYYGEIVAEFFSIKGFDIDIEIKTHQQEPFYIVSAN